jgi:hypothetical protein
MLRCWLAQVSIRTGQMRDWCNVTLTNDVCLGTRKSNGTDGTQQICSWVCDVCDTLWILMDPIMIGIWNKAIVPSMGVPVELWVIVGEAWEPSITTSPMLPCTTRSWRLSFAKRNIEKPRVIACHSRSSWDVGSVRYQVQYIGTCNVSCNVIWFDLCWMMPPCDICDPLWSCKS